MAGRAIRYLELPSYDQGTIFGPGAEPKQSVYEQSATQQHRLGAKFIDGDRIFRYAYNGGTALSKALMTQSEATTGGTLELTSFKEIVQTGHTWSVGDISGTMLVTTGSAAPLNCFADGYLMANKVAAVGDIYRVLASKLQSTDTILDLELETPIRTAISATTELTLTPNRWWGTIVFPTAHTGYATGVPLIDVTANYYYWAQTGGPAPLIVDTAETVVIGDTVGNAAATAVPGACGVRVTLEQAWGNVLQVGAAAEPALVNLTIDMQHIFAELV